MAQVNITIQTGAEQSNVSVQTNPATNVAIQATTGPAGPAATVGTYTPTVDIIQGVASVIPYVHNYVRIGNLVIVTGSMALLTASSGEKYLGVPLPIPSDLQSSLQLSGSISSSMSNTGMYITGDSSANRAFINYISTAQADPVLSYCFSYPVL